MELRREMKPDKAQRQSGSPQQEMIQLLEEQPKQLQQDSIDYAEPVMKPAAGTITAIVLSTDQW